MRYPKDVRIDRERRFVEGDREHDARALPPDTRKRFEFFSGFRNAPGVPLHQRTSGGDDILCLGSKKAARLNETFDIGERRRC